MPPVSRERPTMRTVELYVKRSALYGLLFVYFFLQWLVEAMA